MRPKNFIEIKQRHETLTQLIDAQKPLDEHINQAKAFLVDIQKSGAVVSDMLERQKLLELLYHWRFFVERHTGEILLFTDLEPNLSIDPTIDTTDTSETPAKIFISYASTDTKRVEALYETLKKAGHAPWIASKDISLGEKKSVAIEKAIYQASVILVCWSQASEESKWSKIECDYIFKFPDKLIMPLRFDDCILPDGLLDFQGIDLFNADDEVTLLDAIEATQEQKPEISLVNDESPFGTMKPNSRFYIEREADKLCLQLLGKHESDTLIISGPRQVGKSSLMQRVLAEQAHKICAFIDFQSLPQQFFNESDKFFSQFCLMLSDSLGLPNEVDKYWSGSHASTLKCERYLTKHILPKLDKPLILALDEVDKMFMHEDKVSEVSTDFYAMLRVWHNKRAIQPEFERVTLFLSISTEPGLLIANLNQSPFNVGQHINLADFTHDDVEKLNELYGQPLTSNQVNELMTLLNGHPFLTRLALYKLSLHQVDWQILQQQATSDDGLFGDYLRRYDLMVAEDDGLKKYLVQVCRNEALAEGRTFYRLKSVGLVKKMDGQVVFRNQLYTRYFEVRLNDIF